MIEWPEHITERVGQIKFSDLGIAGSLCKMSIHPRVGTPIECVVSGFYVKNAQNKIGPLRDLYVGKLSLIIDCAIYGLDDFRSIYEETSPEEEALKELVKKYTVSKDGGIDANQGNDQEGLRNG